MSTASLSNSSSAGDIDKVGKSLLGSGYAALRGKYDLRKSGAKDQLIAELMRQAESSSSRQNSSSASSSSATNIAPSTSTPLNPSSSSSSSTSSSSTTTTSSSAAAAAAATSTSSSSTVSNNAIVALLNSTLTTSSSAADFDRFGTTHLGSEYKTLRGKWDLRQTGGKAGLLQDMLTLAHQQFTTPVPRSSAISTPRAPLRHGADTPESAKATVVKGAAAAIDRGDFNDTRRYLFENVPSPSPVRAAAAPLSPAAAVINAGCSNNGDADDDDDDEDDPDYNPEEDEMVDADMVVEDGRRVTRGLSASEMQLFMKQPGIDKINTDTTKLKSYQIEGISWLLNQETSGKGGGILADDMGLGKTIQTLTLIAIQKERARAAGIATGPTLVISGVSQLKSWKEGIHKHFVPNAFSYHINHGADRIANPANFERYDIVVTNWHTVRSHEYGVGGGKSKPDGPMTRIQWERIILDDATSRDGIKNAGTISSKACRALNAKHRWCLSGTPVENSEQDMLSLLQFIRAEPYSNPEWFGQYYGVDEDETIRCNTDVMLRRTKLGILKSEEGTGVQTFPRKFECEIDVEMDSAHQEKYDRIDAGEAVQGYQWSIHLVKILRLRQHSNEVKMDILKELISLLVKGNLEADFEEVGYIRETCSQIRKPPRSVKLSDFTSNGFPPKMCVFSQWNKPLDTIETYLKEHGIGYIKITQAVSQKEREALIDEFNTDPRIQVALLGMLCCGAGINMQKANIAVLLDRHWNPAVENQAVDRVWRGGSEHKGVFVFRFNVEGNGGDEAVMNKQEVKYEIYDRTTNLGVRDP